MAIPFFGKKNGGSGSPSSGDYAPEETPLGPRTYPRVGNGATPRPITGSGRPMFTTPGANGKRGFNLDLRELWRTRKWWIIAGGVLLLIIILSIMAVVGRSNRGSLTEQVQLTITGPELVTLGSDVSYDVQLANNSGTDLTGAELIVIYPDGFSFTTSEPLASNPQGTEFAIGDVVAGAGYSVRVSGRLTGGVKTEQRFIARASFSPEGSPERLQVESSAVTTIETAAFTFTADGPDTSLPSNAVTFDLDLENNEESILEGLQVRAVYPGGFEFQKATPAATEENNIWTIDSLGVGERTEFKIEGVLGGSPDEVKRFVFTAGVLDQDGNFLKQTEVEKIVKLTTPTITLSQTVNGATELAVDPDSDLDYDVTFENTGPAGLTNLVLELSFTSGVWDTKKLSIANGGALKGNLIRWDGVTVPALRALESGQKASVAFSVRPLREPVVDDASDKNFATTSTPTVKIGSASVNGNPVTVKYRSGIAAGATTAVTSGPNPPVVGQATTYEITWTLSNLYNELSGARFVGSIPAGATFVTGSGHVSVGEDLSYNPATQQVLWNIGKVPANVGKLTEDFRATFQVSVTPQPNNVGKTITFVSKQLFSAHDTWTNEERKLELPDIATVTVE